MKIDDIIISENDAFIVLNKPAGLLSIPDREGKDISLKKILQEKFGEIFTVHRLDKETSGLIVFAKTGDAHKNLSQQFEARETEKIYDGLVLGSLAEKKGTVDAPIAEHPTKKGTMAVHRKGKAALTDFEVLEEFGIFSWIKFRIHTGRTHQIRVHMKHLGHPIACDNLYGDGKPLFLSSIKYRYKISKKEEEEKPILSRLALHAQFLKFKTVDQKSFEAEAPLPKDLKALLNQLRKWKK
jgi:23S rRNA pseudouridine955/2504/2580 synthase/23S rRNA pseudouridine1911/1915/1917 synthase